jgi:hypothetical protein
MSRFMTQTTLAHATAKVALSVGACWAVTALAQSPGPTSRPVDGERLSDWLLRQPPAPQAYPLGLMWHTPSERSDQTILEGELLLHLQQRRRAAAGAKTKPETRGRYVPNGGSKYVEAPSCVSQ